MEILKGLQVIRKISEASFIQAVNIQPALTCSTLKIEIVEQDVKYVQGLQ